MVNTKLSFLPANLIGEFVHYSCTRFGYNAHPSHAGTRFRELIDHKWNRDLIPNFRSTDSSSFPKFCNLKKTNPSWLKSQKTWTIHCRVWLLTELHWGRLYHNGTNVLLYHSSCCAEIHHWSCIASSLLESPADLLPAARLHVGLINVADLVHLSENNTHNLNLHDKKALLPPNDTNKVRSDLRPTVDSGMILLTQLPG